MEEKLFKSIMNYDKHRMFMYVFVCVSDRCIVP